MLFQRSEGFVPLFVLCIHSLLSNVRRVRQLKLCLKILIVLQHCLYLWVAWVCKKYEGLSDQMLLYWDKMHKWYRRSLRLKFSVENVKQKHFKKRFTYEFEFFKKTWCFFMSLITQNSFFILIYLFFSSICLWDKVTVSLCNLPN